MKRANLLAHYTMAAISLLLSLVVGTTVLVLNSIAAPPLTPGGPGEEPGAVIRLPAPQPNSRVNVLILGVDEGLLEGGGRAARSRTDTMMLASFDPQTMELNILSIPRDSGVEIPGRSKYDKMGHAHAYGGVPLVIDTLELLLDVPIHYYLRIDHGAFRKLIDAIGGVNYNVERDMNYKDEYQDLYIDLKAGQQHLDGRKAEHYVRYRGVNGSDIERIGRQQRFLLAAIRQAIRPANLLRVNQLVDIAMNSVYTNVDAADVLKYLPYLDGFGDAKITAHVLKGDNKVVDRLWFWVLDKVAMDELLKQYFWDSLQADPSQVTIKLVDASGEGKAQRIADIMKRRGFVVVEVEVAEETSAKTTITAHDNRDVAALMVYRFLRQGELFSDRTEQDVDVTVIVGQDIVR